jgi:hypothetical protein
MLSRTDQKNIANAIKSILHKAERKWLGISFFEDSNEIEIMLFNSNDKGHILNQLEYDYNDSIQIIDKIISKSKILRSQLKGLPEIDAFIRIYIQKLKNDQGLIGKSGFAFNFSSKNQLNECFIIDGEEIDESNKPTEIVDFEGTLLQIAMT